LISIRTINWGSSGGPLFDASGRVIGVTGIIVSPTGGNVGLGFAAPSAIVSRDALSDAPGP
jgi:serine protease Do